MRKKHIIALTAICAIFISVLVTLYFPKETKSKYITNNPTVFVHGYKGTHHSFGNMLSRFEKKYNWGNKAIIYHISEHGKLGVFNLNTGKNNHAFVQIIFEDNRATFEDSAKWLSKVLKHMKSAYNINSVNLVGHSMGGIVSLKYIEEFQDTSGLPVTDKLITIGSPFDGIYNQEYFQVNHDPAAFDLMPDSSAIQLLQKNKASIPKNLKVLNISSTGDRVARPESVQALRTIISRDQLKEVLIEDDDLEHSELHENEEVDYLIHDFLWQDDS